MFGSPLAQVRWTSGAGRVRTARTVLPTSAGVAGMVTSIGTELVASQPPASRTVTVKVAGALSAGCGSRDRKIGEQCKRNSDCREQLRCLKLPNGRGVCTSLCSLPPSGKQKPGLPPRPPAKDNCPGDTHCMKVKVIVEKSGCNRSYEAQTEFNSCVPADLEDQVNSGKPSRVTPP